MIRLLEQGLHIPKCDSFADFQAWTHSPEFPNHGRIDFFAFDLLVAADGGWEDVAAESHPNRASAVLGMSCRIEADHDAIGNIRFTLVTQ